MKSAAIATTLLMASAPLAGQQANPYAKPDSSWIAISGTVESAGPNSFVLDYGKASVTVEMDDWDWYAEGHKLLNGDTVRVYGFIDDDLYETATIEANAVYSRKLGTYFYANSADEEQAYIPLRLDPDPRTIAITGTVTGAQGRAFTIDTGARQLTVDTTGMPDNPLDEKGYLRVREGDRVSVTGRLEETVFSRRQLDATSVLRLSPGKGKER